MKIEYMRELLMLREKKSYTSAAKALFITQPALSRHIEVMEQELNVTLVKRNTHGVEFTEEGFAAASAFERILSTYDSYLGEISERRSGITGTLKLGMLYYTVRRDFGDVLPKFKELYPNIKTKTHSCQPQEVYQMILDGKIDIGALSEADYPLEDKLCFQTLYKASGVVMLDRKHPLANKQSVKLEDLISETVLVLKEDEPTTFSTLEALRRAGFEPRKIIETEHIDTVPFALLNKPCIFIIGTGFDIPGYQDRIVSVPIEDEAFYYTKSYVWRADNKNPTVPLFLETAKKCEL